MSQPLTWHVLMGTEPKPARKYSEQEKEQARKRIIELGEPHWSQVEKMMDIQCLKAIVNSK